MNKPHAVFFLSNDQLLTSNFPVVISRSEFTSWKIYCIKLRDIRAHLNQHNEVTVYKNESGVGGNSVWVGDGVVVRAQLFLAQESPRIKRPVLTSFLEVK